MKNGLRTLLVFFLLWGLPALSLANDMEFTLLTSDVNSALTVKKADGTVVFKARGDGVLHLPGITKAQRVAIASPTAGMLTYQTDDTPGFYFFNGTQWGRLASLPKNSAVSVAFSDTDVDGGQVTGAVTVTKAANESSLTHYVLYWGSNATTKLAGQSAITTLAKTGLNLTHTFSDNTAIPSGATYLLVFTKNADGEMSTGVNVTITDKFIPTQTATSMAFSDTNIDGGQVAGAVTIIKGSNESALTHYVLYWGSNATTKLADQSAIATLAKTGSNITYTFSANTAIPSGATNLLVFTKNADGEMSTGVNVAVTDKSIPTQTATSVAFSDTDLDGGQVAGAVTITKAANESSLTHYVLYWGSNATTKLAGPSAITTLAKTGLNLTHTFSDNTAIPSGATYLLVFTKNADGEMSTGVNVAVTDKSIPTQTATSVAFSDTDLDGGQVAGAVTITKAANESSLTHYVLYWGSSITTKLAGQSAITTLAKTGSNLTHTFSANTAIPSGATYLLVFTKNADGEMSTGVNVAITDKSIPTQTATSVAFSDTDLDGGQVAGAVTITKAANESSLTHYVLYWGSNATTKLAGQLAITTLAKTGSNLTHTFLDNTAIPSGATYLLVFTKNTDGEMSTGVNVAITDKSIPTQTATSVAFSDTDLDGGQVAGAVTITKAANESTLTHYVLYWGSSTTTKLAGQSAVTTLAKTGSNLTHTFLDNTSIPSGATYLLVFTKNADVEMTTGVSTTINKTTIDTVTNLMWQDNDYTGRHDWANAISYCDNLDLAGYSDWRLPSSGELSGLYARRSILRSYRSSYYWSSTTYAYHTSGAWGVYFSYGGVDGSNKTNTYYVRCVRGGQ
ncbi:DUF1566 domain-containing protein [Deltaproteobacteria bacterium TL4]